jgi:hypothetical protein
MRQRDGLTPGVVNALSFKGYIKMRTLICIGYENYSCGKIIKQTSNNHERCESCARANKNLKIKDSRQQTINKGMCRSHPKIPVALGKRKCQGCLDAIKNNRAYLLSKGVCPIHPNVSLSPGKSLCQQCLDYTAIFKLPKNAKLAAQKKADETREARINGSYICPILGKTEEEIRILFPSKCNKSIWEFDHIGDLFRDIISGPANRIIKNFSSKELIRSTAYVKKHEI